MQTEAKSAQSQEASKDRASPSAPVSSIIVSVVIAAVVGLSVWYLVRPQTVLVQGEADATRFDIAARVDGRVAEIPLNEGQDVVAGAMLVRIDNPETIAKNEQALAAKIAAEAQLANINAGTRAEVTAARKAALERAESSVILAQKPMTVRINWPSTAMLRRRRSTRRLTPYTRPSAQRTRPNRPTSKQSMVTRARSMRSPRRTLGRRSPTSRPCNQLSIRW